MAGLPYLGTSADLNASPSPSPWPWPWPWAAPPAAPPWWPGSRRRYLSFPALVHPRVALAPRQRIALGAGCIIQQGCIVLTCDITLGRFVLLNLGCTVGHDAVLDDFCALMPHANVSGAAHLAVRRLPRHQRHHYSGRAHRGPQHRLLGAGAVAVRDLPANITAVGMSRPWAVPAVSRSSELSEQ